MARVLQIEDDAGYRELVKRRLAGQIDVDFAETMHDGIVKAQTGEYDGILLDPGLQDAHRNDAYQILKGSVKNVAIILLTGYNDNQWARDQIAQNASGVLLKDRDDVEPVSFAYQIKRAIATHRACLAIDSAEL